MPTTAATAAIHNPNSTSNSAGTNYCNSAAASEVGLNFAVLEDSKIW